MSNTVSTRGEERHILPDDPRQPVKHLTYPHGVHPSAHEPMGPNTLGEMVWPVTVQHLEWRTRVGFSYLPPAEAVTQ